MKTWCKRRGHEMYQGKSLKLTIIIDYNLRKITLKTFLINDHSYNKVIYVTDKYTKYCM